MIQGWQHLVIVCCICYILHYLINKNKKAKSQDERLAKGIRVDEGDWEAYFAKLCRITKKNAHELMKIAAEEAGMNLTDGMISQHFREFVRTGDLPHFVIKFLKNGKEYIDSIDEGPDRPKMPPPTF